MQASAYRKIENNTNLSNWKTSYHLHYSHCYYIRSVKIIRIMNTAQCLITVWIEPWYKHTDTFSPATTLTRFENTLIQRVLSVSLPENSYKIKFSVKARWPVKPLVQYDQSEGEHAGSTDEHATRWLKSSTQWPTQWPIQLTNCIWNYSQFNKHKNEKTNQNNQNNQNNSPPRTNA